MVFCVLLCFLVVGLFRVSINGNPTQWVATDSARYKAFDSRLAHFPAEQMQLHVFTQSPVLDNDHLQRYLAASVALSTLPNVRFVASLFSPPTLASALHKLIEEPDKSVKSGLVDDVKALLTQPDFLPSSMVSTSFDAARLSITLGSHEHMSRSIERIKETLNSIYPSQSGIPWFMVGNPIVQQAIERDVLRELLRVTLIAALFGVLVAAWVIQDAKAIAVLVGVPTAAVLGSVGLMGWLGIELTLLSQAVMVVVFLVVFTDTLHTLQSSRSRSSLALACGLTSLTTAAAAVALWFASAVIIQQFALSLIVGIAVGFLVWFLWLLAWGESYKKRRNGSLKNQTKTFNWLSRFGLTRKTRWLFTGLSFVVLLALGAQLRTGFSITENLPRTLEVAEALSIAEQKFSGYQPLEMLVSASDSSIATEPFLENIAKLQNELNDDILNLRWYSIVDVMALTPGMTYEDRLSLVPEPLLETLWNDNKEVVLFAPNSISAWLQAPTETLDTIEDTVQGIVHELNLEAGPVTGMPVLVRDVSDALLSDAWRSVLLTVLVLAGLVMVVLGSVRLACLAGVPVIFGLAAYAATLVLLGESLTHAGVVMMTLVMGLSVDNALHLIVSAGRQHAWKPKIQRRAINECFSVLHLATLVTMAGFIALAFSAIPSLSVLGLAASCALAVGFLASLWCLPPVLLKGS